MNEEEPDNTSVSSKLENINFNFLDYGTTVKCTTCFNDVIEGQVLSYDLPMKLLILNCPVTETNSFKTRLISLNYCSDMDVINETKEKENNIYIYNIPQIIYEDNIELEKKQFKRKRAYYIAAYNPRASETSMNLFKTIAKLYQPSEVFWKKRIIVILHSVVIKPPYTEADVYTSNNSHKFCEYIKKVVQRFYILHEQRNLKNDMLH